LSANFSGHRLGELELIIAEITSNLVKHATKGGMILARIIQDEGGGMELIAIDNGPGMLMPAKMMEDGQSTKRTLGQGLGAVVSGYASRVDQQAGTPVDGLTAAYQRILAGLVVATLFWLAMKSRKPEVKTDGAAAARSGKPIWPWIIANALAGPALGVGCYQWALMQEKSGVVLPIVALTPLVIIPFSRFVEGERPRKRSLVGGLIAVAGVVILADGLALIRRWIDG
jgi:anti-sigma regulatory factor (Ser/Thr protein kinase)